MKDMKRNELRKYAKYYTDKGFGIHRYDAIMLYIDFKFLFNQGEFQSKKLMTILHQNIQEIKRIIRILADRI